MKSRFFLRALLALSLFATITGAADPKVIRFGVAPGPYGDLITQAIKPGLEKKGYKVSLVQFQDYVQPNLALQNKETEANLFQHQLYLEKFSADHKLQLSSIINVPTAGLGIYSSKIKSLKELNSGDEVVLSQDPTNLARGLRFLQKLGLITLKADVDPTKVTERDIAANPVGLRFTLLEAAQIPRSLGSARAALINGNFAIAAGLRLQDALALELLDENIKNVIAIRNEDLNKQFAKDIQEVVRSEGFYKVVSDPKNIFVSFQQPEWFVQKWSRKK